MESTPRTVIGVLAVQGDVASERDVAAMFDAATDLYAAVAAEPAPVGCVLVDAAGQLLGEGHTQAVGQAHAEVMALRDAAADGTPMLMICGMYQLFGKAFVTVQGERLPGLGILDVTTQGNEKRMIGPIVLSTDHGDVVGYENHSGSTTLGAGQAPFGRVRHGMGNNGTDGTEGAVTGHVIGSYLHGPILPANPRLADTLIGWAAERATGRPVHRAIVWQDRRTAERCAELKAAGHEPRVREVHAVKDVSFVARHGESIGIIGRNGSGKSTLLRAVAGLMCSAAPISSFDSPWPTAASTSRRAPGAAPRSSAAACSTSSRARSPRSTRGDAWVRRSTTRGRSIPTGSRALPA